MKTITDHIDFSLKIDEILNRTSCDENETFGFGIVKVSDIDSSSNIKSKIEKFANNEEKFEETARIFLSNKGINDFHMFQEEFSALQSELNLFSKDEETTIKTQPTYIPNTNDKYYHKIQAQIPEELYPTFLQWARIMSKVEARKKGFKIPIEYKAIWNGEIKEGKALIVAPTFRKLPKGLGVNRFGDVDMEDILEYGLDNDIQNMYNQLVCNWEEFSKYLESLKPGEKPEKPKWMTEEQWAEIYAITLKEVYDEREVVHAIPEEVAEMYFEKMKKEKLALQKGNEANVITIEGKDVSEENIGDDDNYSL